MRIKTIQDCTGFPDGYTARKYPAGLKLTAPADIPNELADTFVRQGWAARPETPETPNRKAAK